jgi:FkbM family methyltransferase
MLDPDPRRRLHISLIFIATTYRCRLIARLPPNRGRRARRQVGQVHTLAGKGPSESCLEEDLGPANTPQLFAFEPDATNFAMLQDAFDGVVHNYTAGGKHPVPRARAVLRNVAVSRERGRMPFGFGGGEISSFKFKWGGEAQTTVEVVTLDEELLDRPDPVARVDFLKSDTEGHDWWVMQGARRLLESGRIALWFFEYHGVGLWDPGFGDGHVTLRAVTEYLSGVGYSSYYVGKQHLLRIDGDYWREPYELRTWSNVLAIRRDHPLHTRLVLLLNDWRIPCPAGESAGK